MESKEKTLIEKEVRFVVILYIHMIKLQEIVRSREAWHATVHRFAKSRTQLNDLTTKPYAKAEFIN